MACTRSARVTVYTAPGCHLCGEALAVVAEVCGDDVAVVDISGDAELEARYRERLPVIAVDGEEAFVYRVEAEDLRERLARP